ncbi:NAD(P)H-hydrate dehydratase [Lysobacter sp. BMK333-48F3]|uniref:NAD(P)H-hydrate dehydratase n=1 Tax=Lysobacter sp. BMK333-48F3 TaxID=2867962 RepID=UPI001C8C4B0A|nr:NAD(P)H-hydrate dehydratase [Lysobacter sp. BMK333-48F3]MBX9403660.1 NAD(P)H-hydrate dehydratase [Lysobacter sp. BMK333-48F3]
MSPNDEIADETAPAPGSALYDAVALRAIEARAAAELGEAYALMQRAGAAAWSELLNRWTRAFRLLVVCGPGNNGGDGYVLATLARQSGRDVAVLRLPEHAPRSALARRAAAEYAQAGGAALEFDGALPAADVVVDALFGIGLSRAPDAASAALIAAINAHPAPVLALDAPSGVDADSGRAHAAAVNAQRTLEFIAPKAGLRSGAALDHTGALALASLQLAPERYGIEAVAEALAADDLGRWLRPRRRDSHKGRNGRVLCVGGDHGHGGALLLCAQAALRSGAGLLDAATRAAHVAPMLARLPEAMPRAVDDSNALNGSALNGAELDAALDAADAVAIGPGLGQQAWGRALYARVLACAKPRLFDADALNLLAAQPQPLPADCVLTPHPGEAARLLGCDTAHVQDDRFAAVSALAERYGCAVVLKGAGSLVAAPRRRTRVIGAGNPGMAVGGMGDVLSGVVAALLAQGLDGFDAASCGALLHAVAGDQAARDGGERGLLPSDLMPWLRRCANPRGAA